MLARARKKHMEGLQLADKKQRTAITMNSNEMKRREFLQATATIGLAAAGGALCPQVFAAEPLEMRLGSSGLRVQPVLI